MRIEKKTEIHVLATTARLAPQLSNSATPMHFSIAGGFFTCMEKDLQAAQLARALESASRSQRSAKARSSFRAGSFGGKRSQTGPVTRENRLLAKSPGMCV
jgi:hypothetical protein